MKEWIRSIFKTLRYTSAHSAIILALKLMTGSHFQTSFPHLKVQKHSKERILKEKRKSLLEKTASYYCFTILYHQPGKASLTTSD